MNRQKIFSVLLSAVVVIGLIMAYWLRVGGAAGECLRALLYVGTPAVAMVMSLFAFIRYSNRGTYAPVLMCFFIALALWTVGEVLWVYYESIAHIDPFPSVADGFYVAAYPFFVAGALAALQKSNFSLLRYDPIIKFLMALVIVAALGMIAYFGIYLGYDNTLTVLGNVISVGYALGDILILIVCLCVLILAWEFRGGYLMRLWLAVFTAFMMVLLADIGFAVYNNDYIAGVPWIKNTLDSLWILSYLYFALGFSAFTSLIEEAQRRLGQQKGVR